MQLKKLSVGPGIELWKAKEWAESLGNAGGFNLVVTTLQVCWRHKTVNFPMVMLTGTTSADPLDRGFRWQVALGTGAFSPCGFGQRSLPVLKGLEAGWPEKWLQLLLEAMAGITWTSCHQYSGDQLAQVVVLSRMWLSILSVPGCLKIVPPSVIPWETYSPIY